MVQIRKTQTRTNQGRAPFDSATEHLTHVSGGCTVGPTGAWAGIFATSTVANEDAKRLRVRQMIAHIIAYDKRLRISELGAEL